MNSRVPFAKNLQFTDDSEFVTPPSSPSRSSNNESSDSSDEDDMDLADDSITEDIFLEGYVLFIDSKKMFFFFYRNAI